LECDTTQTVPAPLMGQHNRRIAGDLGYSKREIDAMVRDGVLYAEEAVSRLPA
jgi:crotonobetainyl-CoA:carnitine CoA-transferase CaiB-like acyl-CoA transferase